LGTEQRTQLVLQHVLAAYRSGLADKAAVLAVLVVHLKNTESNTCRKTIYEHLQELLREPEDLFLFLGKVPVVVHLQYEHAVPC
jgi:hypothetical protein